MFYQRFCSSITYKIILTVLTVVLMILAIMHFATAGMTGTMKDKTSQLLNDSNNNTSKYGVTVSVDNATDKAYNSMIAHYSITGILQIFINIFYLVLLWQCIALSKIKIGVIMSLMLIEFGLIFAIAVQSSYSWSFYGVSLSSYINVSDQVYQYFPQSLKDYSSTATSFFRFLIFQSIATFFISLPIIYAQIIMMLDKNISFKYLEVKVDEQKSRENITPEIVNVQ